MKIKLLPRPEQGLTLCGLIVGVIFIIFLVIVIRSLVRATHIPPRDLPREFIELYPDYFTNYASSVPWPVKFTPMSIDMITKDPTGPVTEKVFLADSFLVEVAQGSLTNWQPQFQWIVGLSAVGSVGLMSDEVPKVYGFQTFSNELGTLKMNRDFSGFEINPSSRALTNRAIFWRTSPLQ